MNPAEDAGRSGAGRASFWEDPEVVREFAGRAPDHRLVRLVEDCARPDAVRVLDLGCAGGRNTEYLVGRGFDVVALDPSAAMVACTRARLVPLLGEEAAARRVRAGRMQDLGAFPDGSMDWILALGVFHNARDTRDWERSVSESARVLKPGGRLLVASFSPRSQPQGVPLEPVPEDEHLFSGFESGSLYLLEPDRLDARLSAFGLHPEEPTAAVKVPTEKGFRVTVNGLYRRADTASRPAGPPED